VITLRECSPADGTSTGDPGPERAAPGEIALLAGLVAVGLVPFARLALGGRFGAPRLALGAAVAILNGAQLVRDLLRPPDGGARHGRPVSRPHLVLLRGHVRPGVAPGPLVRGRR
jgi:hypothetical protein